MHPSTTSTSPFPLTTTWAGGGLDANYDEARRQPPLELEH
jgi:hypothetical protein